MIIENINDVYKGTDKRLAMTTARFIDMLVNASVNIRETSLNDQDKRERAEKLNIETGISLLTIHKMIW